jgi:hypothetical protein
LAHTGASVGGRMVLKLCDDVASNNNNINQSIYCNATSRQQSTRCDKMRQFSLITDSYGTIIYNYDQLWHNYCIIHPYLFKSKVLWCLVVSLMQLLCCLSDSSRWRRIAYSAQIAEPKEQSLTRSNNSVQIRTNIIHIHTVDLCRSL